MSADRGWLKPKENSLKAKISCKSSRRRSSMSSVAQRLRKNRNSKTKTN